MTDMAGMAHAMAVAVEVSRVFMTVAAFGLTLLLFVPWGGGDGD